MEFHPVAELFPLMSEKEFEDLCADVSANGLREAIWTHDGKIVDGRNRFKACSATNTEPRFRPWDGEGSLVSFVVSLNMNRRHLSESQRAMVAAKIANVDGSGEHSEAAPIGAVISQDTAAKMLNVSRQSVSRAAKVQKQGVTELVEMVEANEISVSKAATIASLSKPKQKRMIKRGRLAGKKRITELKIKSIEAFIKTGSGCLGCDREAVFTKESVSAFMQDLTERAPAFARYFDSVVEELEEMDMADDTREAYDLIQDAVERGFQEETQIVKITKLAKDVVRHALTLMVDNGLLETIQQGGKTETARGARKTLYQIAEKPAERELAYELEMELEERSADLEFASI